MNREIRRLFFVICGLLVALIGMVTYWLWRAPDLEARQGNPALVVRQVTIDRGLVLAADGSTVLARNRQRTVQGRTWFERRYPQAGLTAHAVGYSTLARSRTGLERSFNDFLTGSNGNLTTVIDRISSKFEGDVQRGNHLVLTIDAQAQRAALDALDGRCGSIVALEPASGRVLVLASSPTFDPNLAEERFDEIESIRAPCTPAAPLLDRATQGLFVPGSTFKVVTAAAALDTGRYTPASTFFDRGYCVEYGKRVSNFADQSGPEQFGRVDLTDALVHSINSVFCDIGKELGPSVVLDYAKRFGFYDVPPLELPAGERLASGLYSRGSLYEPRLESDVDPGRLAFGQERLLATPLQMALVAAAVANDGVVMRPFLVDRILQPDRSTLSRSEPKELRRAISAQTAAELRAMMEAAVARGTGTGASIDGLRVAGKTGTAETGRTGNDVWFIGFAPVDAPRVAIAVAVSDQPGTGGAIAAPIARTVLAALLGRQ